MRLHNFVVVCSRRLLCDCIIFARGRRRRAHHRRSSRGSGAQGQPAPALRREARPGSSHDQALSVGARLLPGVHLSEECQHWDCPFAIDFMTFVGGCQTNPMQFVVRKQRHQQLRRGDQPAARRPLAHRLRLRGAALERQGERRRRQGVAGGGDARRCARRTCSTSRRARSSRSRRPRWASSPSRSRSPRRASRRASSPTPTSCACRWRRPTRASSRSRRTPRAWWRTTNLVDAIGLRRRRRRGVRRADARCSSMSAQPMPDLGAATSTAERKRPEVAQADASALAAGRYVERARYLSLLPEVDAEGGYVRTDGQLFAPPNQCFVGVKATWAIWEWGATLLPGARGAAPGRRVADRSREPEAAGRRRGAATPPRRPRPPASPSTWRAAGDRQSAQEAYRVDAGAGAGRLGDDHRPARRAVGVPHGAPEPGARAVRARHPARRARPRHGRLTHHRPCPLFKPAPHLIRPRP